MQDRHSLSDPRPKSSTNASCVWLVDIYRQGVTNPVDTIELSEATLPPRMNKKGKVAWRLPTDGSRLVRYVIIIMMIII
jgi:hypothetical protein